MQSVGNPNQNRCETMTLPALIARLTELERTEKEAIGDYAKYWGRRNVRMVAAYEALPLLLEALIIQRDALEHIAGNRGYTSDCCRRAFQNDELDNHDAEIAAAALARVDALVGKGA